MGIIHTYYKDFRQRTWHYCFDRINELKKRMVEDQEELEFFEQLQKEQKRCTACNGMGEIRNYCDWMACKACNGTGNGGT